MIARKQGKYPIPAHENMSERIPDDLGKRALQRLTLFEPDSPKSVCSTLPEPSIGVITCDRIASSTQGVFHYVPDPPEDSIGVRALSKLIPKDYMPELRSAENVSEFGEFFGFDYGIDGAWAMSA